MTKLNFPAVTGLTPFDRQDLNPCTATFERELTAEEQSALNAAVKQFHAATPANSRSPIFFLEFAAHPASVMRFRVQSNREMPTRLLFDGLIRFLTERFDLTIPAAVADSTERVLHPDSPMTSTPTATSKLFVKRHPGF